MAQYDTFRGDAAALAAELRAAIEGDVRFDAQSRALYSTDASNYRQIPIGVVLPRSADDVLATIEIARRHDAPILGRGGGTSLAGQCCNVAIVLDFSKYMNRILEIDPARQIARVQPGVVLDTLRDAAEEFNLTFGPDPATHSRCTLGGMIGNNSCGVHSIMAGKTDANVIELDVVTYDGLRMRVGPTDHEKLDAIRAEGGRKRDIHDALASIAERYGDRIRERFPKIPRNVSGYNLEQLLPENGFNVARALVGTEGTCVVVLEATVRLVHSPPARQLVVLGYDDVFDAADDVPDVMSYGPIGLEGFDDRLVRDMTVKGLHPESVPLLPPGAGWLLAEFGGATTEEARAKGEAMIASISKRTARKPSMKLFDNPIEAKMVWRVRESALGATAVVPGRPHAWEGWEDAAVRPDLLGSYLRQLRALLDEYGYIGDFYGHFGEGCIHTRNDFDLQTREGIEKYRRFIYEAAHLVVRHEGSISGEHGDGQARAELLPIQFGEDLVEAFREFKRAWDPNNRMNPGKVVDPYRADENLRLGVDYVEKNPKTHFHYPQDDGVFDHAALRCVGVGECRRDGYGTMCPSWMVTHEEKHSTRGRARLLFEMLRGEVIRDGWKSEEVKDALDLCLACKGCKSDCPVNVDMATYKAEFLSHYYRGRLRPLAAYGMGLIHLWLPFAALAPRIANAKMKILGPLLKRIGGIHPKRELPKLATKTFRQSWETRERRGGKRVILWTDTFTNHFRPSIAHDAVTVLEAAGLDVDIPAKRICCGRPLYDWGFVPMARRQLQRIVSELRDEIRAGIPIVGLEPSCVAVFRDELPNLFPDDGDAIRLSKQFFTLAEILEREAPGFAPKIDAPVLFHGHCHHKSIMKVSADVALLRRCDSDLTVLDSGCCGMAGAFGFEKKHYDVSVAAGERVLLPAVRGASSETIVLTDGFSCREQVEQEAGRRPSHLAEVLADAVRRSPSS